ncbi:cobalamin B12-binding domain protein [Methylobacterium sp. 4-46]|uniref:cobalamin B12-binding domain-containing protein n=1 Tax=unclassified Methylobacterium TaxID=2615210 RepID=UPI000152CA1E|nr:MULTISPECIES: cobalamin B12-binding domain-containing protein [Methylobacterium]ACA18096.1 cobalamin B12-binding domain protein [Methylobacterium sp. 4-46]WFT77394.1 cobalamin B12-binding domain-containing protein [Methylobacterium nodulans]
MGDPRYSGDLTGSFVPPRESPCGEAGGLGRGARWRDDLARVVEAEIIPRLMLAHRSERPRVRAVGRPPIAEEVVRFSALMLAPQDADVMAEIRGLLDGGLGLDDLLLGLLAPTARHIGRLWEEDECDFVQVTVAMARLRRIVHDLELLFLDPHPVDPASRRVLLMPAPGEMHTFGLTLVAHFFGEAGWDVTSSVDRQLTEPMARMRAEWFDVIGLSLSCDVHLDALTEIIPVIRRGSRNRGVSILVGGPAFHDRPDRVRHAGADAAVGDARNAPGIAQSLLDLRVRAC